jgi:hypothetical protein
MSNQPFEFRPSGIIEFEQIAPEALIEKAKAPVDDAMDGDPLSINFGRRKDHKPAAAERMLAGSTIDWLVAFPIPARPKALCERYPHVANRLALNWQDKAGSARSLQTLIGDARWGSAGFPAQVQGELQRLLQCAPAVQH